MLFLFSIPCDGKKVNTENAKITGMTSCEAQLKSFSVQQFFKNAAEVWASSPHLRSKSKLYHKIKQKSKSKSEESQLLLKLEGCKYGKRFQGQLRFPRQAGDVPQPCRTGFGWYSKGNVSRETLLLGKSIVSGSAESLRCLPLCCSPVVVLSELIMNLS